MLLLPGRRRVAWVLVTGLAGAAIAIAHGESAATGARPWGVLAAALVALAGLALAYRLRRDAPLEQGVLALTAILLALPLVGRLAVLRHGVIVTTLDGDLVRALVLAGLGAAAGAIGAAACVVARDEPAVGGVRRRPSRRRTARRARRAARPHRGRHPRERSAGRLRGRHPTRIPDGDPGVEVDRVDARLLRGRERKVRHGRRVDVASAGVLDRHRQAELHGDVAHERRRPDAADARDLDRDAIGDAVAVGGEQRRERVDALVEHEAGAGRRRAGAALLVLMHGCSTVIASPCVARRNSRACAVVQAPFASQKSTTSPGTAERTACTRSTSFPRIAAHLELDAPVARRDVGRGARGHRHGRGLRDGAVDSTELAVAAAEVRAQRHAGSLRSEVVEGHVERRLDGRLSEHGAIEGARTRRGCRGSAPTRSGASWATPARVAAANPGG